MKDKIKVGDRVRLYTGYAALYSDDGEDTIEFSARDGVIVGIGYDIQEIDFEFEDAKAIKPILHVLFNGNGRFPELKHFIEPMYAAFPTENGHQPIPSFSALTLLRKKKARIKASRNCAYGNIMDKLMEEHQRLAEHHQATVEMLKRIEHDKA